MLPFLKSATERCADIGFLFVPRHKHAEHYQQYGLPDNVIFIHELDAYQSMAAGDIHTTLNSTCALEAPSLGTVNVLMNIDNMARKYLEKLLVENESTYYASNVDEFCELVRKVPVSDKNLMKSSNSGNIRENFKSNLKWAIDKIVND